MPDMYYNTGNVTYARVDNNQQLFNYDQAQQATLQENMRCRYVQLQQPHVQATNVAACHPQQVQQVVGNMVPSTYNMAPVQHQSMQAPGSSPMYNDPSGQRPTYVRHEGSFPGNVTINNDAYDDIVCVGTVVPPSPAVTVTVENNTSKKQKVCISEEMSDITNRTESASQPGISNGELGGLRL